MDNGEWKPGLRFRILSPDLLFTNIARNPCAFSNGNGEQLYLRAAQSGQDLLYTTNSGGNLPMENGEWNLELRASCEAGTPHPTIITSFLRKLLAMENGTSRCIPAA